MPFTLRKTLIDRTMRLTDAAGATLFALLLVLGGAPVAATHSSPQQEGVDKEPRPFTVIKRLRYRMAGEMIPHISIFHLRASEDAESNSLILSGAEDQVDAAIKVLEALDAPTQSDLSYELIVTILRASPDGEIEVAERLEGVVNRLRGVFPYRGYETEDVILTRVSGGRMVSAEGTIVGGDPYGFHIRQVKVEDPDEGESERRIFLSGVSFALRSRTENFTKASFETSVELREGQIAVLGKATTQTTSGALGALVLLVELVPAE